MTPERLEQLRQDSRDGYVIPASELLDEVERLRAGIEALADEFDDPPGDLWYGPEYYSGLAGAANAARALLDPTEGETDE